MSDQQLKCDKMRIDGHQMMEDGAYCIAWVRPPNRMLMSLGPRRQRTHWQTRPTRGYHYLHFYAVISCSFQIFCSQVVELASAALIVIVILLLLYISSCSPVHEVGRRSMTHWSVRSHGAMRGRTKAGSRAVRTKVMRPRWSGS